MSGRAERVAELVKSAVEREPEHWPEFLDQECGSDAALRAEIESLLEQHEHATRFIETQALHLAAESLVRDGAFHAGQIIGDYEILSLIGTGGMGVAYRDLGRREVRPRAHRDGVGDAVLGKHEQRLLGRDESASATR